MLLHDSRSPIFDQTVDKDLPKIPYDEFLVHIETKFKQSGKPILDHAAERIVKLGDTHPKRTQQLAAAVWDAHTSTKPINTDEIDDAYDDLLA